MNKWQTSQAFPSATSVNGTDHPTLENMIAVGIKNKMKENRCREIYKEITLQTKCGEKYLLREDFISLKEKNKNP